MRNTLTITLPADGDDDQPLADATPSEIGHRGPIQIVFPPDGRTRVSPTTPYPWRALGQLWMEFANGRTYTGTGALIGKRHVLTAAHNVYEKNTKIVGCRFAPARDGDRLPQEVHVLRAYITEDYATLSPPNPNDPAQGGDVICTQYTEDYAVLLLEHDVRQPASLMPCAAPDGQLSRAVATVAGYPGDKEPFGTLWTASGPLEPDSELLFYKISTYGGQSGSPVLIPGPDGTQAVVGVHVAGAREHGSNFAVRLTPGRIDQINAWLHM